MNIQKPTEESSPEPRQLSNSSGSERPVNERHAPKFIFGYLFIIILVVAIGATYAWQHNKVQVLSEQLASLSKQTAPSAARGSAIPSTPAASPRYTTDVGVGYPLSLPHKKVLTTLTLPTGFNVFQYEGDLKGQDQLAGVYTKSFNDILARWFFTPQGTASKPSSAFKSSGQIFTSSMSQWESSDDTAPVYYPSLYGGPAAKLTTDQKQTFVSQLKSQTANCAGDANKGFSTNDKVYNICYTLGHPQAVDGDWTLFLSGYGEVDGTPLYFGGSMGLPNATYQTDLNAYIQALKNITTVVSANNN